MEFEILWPHAIEYRRSMTTAAPTTTFHKFALVWTALVTVIPTIFGIIMLIDATPISTPGTTVVDVFHAMAFRNFAFSAVLAFALFTQPKRVVAVLLVARGLTEWADALSGIFAASPGASVAPWLGGLGDLIIGIYFYRKG